MAENGNRGQFKPGDSRAGRPKGTPNKATADVRSAFAAFVEQNAGKAQELFDRVAKDDPAKALDLLARLAEFVVPKLSRSTIDGELAVRGTLVIHD